MHQPSPLLNLPETRTERWSLLSQLIAEWYCPLAPEDGYSDDQLQECAARLGIALPVALREWYGLAGRRDDVWRQQDTLLSPEKLFSRQGVLHFCIENQAVTSWGVQIADLKQEDPPVVVRDEHEDWIVQSSRMSEFVLNLFAFLVQFGADIAHIRGYAHPSCLNCIVGELPALSFPEFVWTRTRLFGFADLIVAIDDTHHVTASGRRDGSFAPFQRLIDGSEFDVY